MNASTWLDLFCGAGGSTEGPVTVPANTVTTTDRNGLLSYPPPDPASTGAPEPGLAPVLAGRSVRTHGSTGGVRRGKNREQERELAGAVPDDLVNACTFRMFTPVEIGLTMAFPAGYRTVGPKRDVVRAFGNAVTPPVARLLGERLRPTLTAV